MWTPVERFVGLPRMWRHALLADGLDLSRQPSGNCSAAGWLASALG
jgi:hypothetical protein